MPVRLHRTAGRVCLRLSQPGVLTAAATATTTLRDTAIVSFR